MNEAELQYLAEYTEKSTSGTRILGEGNSTFKEIQDNLLSHIETENCIKKSSVCLPNGQPQSLYNFFSFLETAKIYFAALVVQIYI